MSADPDSAFKVLQDLEHAGQQNMSNQDVKLSKHDNLLDRYHCNETDLCQPFQNRTDNSNLALQRGG